MGKCCVAILGLVAGVACDNGYPLAPSPCDDFCLALQRADCAEDWPDDCVRQCEFNQSPERHPDCAAEFETLLACYQALDDDAFTCIDEQSEARGGFCEEERFKQQACVYPILFREVYLCEVRAERCPDFDRYLCLSVRAEVPPACEEEGIRYLDCEIADETACSRSLRCETLEYELSLCRFEARD